MDQLHRLLENDFPRFERAIRAGAVLCPEYTGRRPTGPAVSCRRVADVAAFWENPGGDDALKTIVKDVKR